MTSLLTKLNWKQHEHGIIIYICDNYLLKKRFIKNSAMKSNKIATRVEDC